MGTERVLFEISKRILCVLRLMCCGLHVFNGTTTIPKNLWRWDKYALVNKHFLPTQSLDLKVKQKPEQTAAYNLYIDLPETGLEV